HPLRQLVGTQVRRGSGQAGVRRRSQTIGRRGTGDGYRQPRSGARRNRGAPDRPRARTAPGGGPSAAVHSALRRRRARGLRRQPARTRQAPPSLREALGGLAPHRRQSGRRRRVLSRPPGRTLRHLRRGSSALWQRLAQQRSVGALRQGVGGGARVLQRQERRGAGEIFLEKLGGGVPLGETRERATATAARRRGMMPAYDAIKEPRKNNYTVAAWAMWRRHSCRPRSDSSGRMPGLAPKRVPRSRDAAD